MSSTAVKGRRPCAELTPTEASVLFVDHDVVRGSDLGDRLPSDVSESAAVLARGTHCARNSDETDAAGEGTSHHKCNDNTDEAHDLAWYRARLEESQLELEEYQVSSRELELELETQLNQLERENRELRTAKQRAETDRDVFADRLAHVTKELRAQLELLEEQLGRERDSNEQLARHVRDLEQHNDDLERAKRTLAASLESFDARLNDAIERNAFLESELDEKQQLSVMVQRLKEETRDLKQELCFVQRRNNLLHQQQHKQQESGLDTTRDSCTASQQVSSLNQQAQQLQLAQPPQCSRRCRSPLPYGRRQLSLLQSQLPQQYNAQQYPDWPIKNMKLQQEKLVKSDLNGDACMNADRGGNDKYSPVLATGFCLVDGKDTVDGVGKNSKDKAAEGRSDRVAPSLVCSDDRQDNEQINKDTPNLIASTYLSTATTWGRRRSSLGAAVEESLETVATTSNSAAGGGSVMSGSRKRATLGGFGGGRSTPSAVSGCSGSGLSSAGSRSNALDIVSDLLRKVTTLLNVAIATPPMRRRMRSRSASSTSHASGGGHHLHQFTQHHSSCDDGSCTNKRTIETNNNNSNSNSSNAVPLGESGRLRVGSCRKGRGRAVLEKESPSTESVFYLGTNVCSGGAASSPDEGSANNGVACVRATSTPFFGSNRKLAGRASKVNSTGATNTGRDVC